MFKSSAILVPVTFLAVLVSALLNNICCACSPAVAIVLGIAAGYLTAFLEKPTDLERGAVRGAMTGAFAGAAALVAEFIGVGISQYMLNSSGNPQACLPGLCSLASTPMNQTSLILGELFYSCFCGLMLLPPMAGLGALGAVIWSKTSGKKQVAQPPDPVDGQGQISQTF